MLGVSDLPQVALVAIAISLVNTLMMVGIALVHPREPGPAVWTLGNLTFALGLGVMVLRDPPDEPIGTYVGHLLFVIGFLVFWWGCLRFRRQRPRHGIGILLLVLFALPFAYFQFVEPSQPARAIVSCTVLAFLCGAIAWSMLRRIEPGLLQSQAFVGLIFVLLGMLYFLRTLAVATGVVDRPGFGSSPLGGGIFLIPALASLLATLGCGLMLAQRLQQRLVASTRTDTLTGLLNRFSLDERGVKEVSRARRHNVPLTLAVFDIDHLGILNRRHGTEAMDAVIGQFAGIVGGLIRQEDEFGRVEGGSFCIILPLTPLADAQQMAERLRQMVAATRFHSGSLQDIQLTVSIGIAAFGLHGDDWATMLQRAQTALYRAKSEGRNRVEMAAFSAQPGPSGPATAAGRTPPDPAFPSAEDDRPPRRWSTRHRV